MASEYGTFKGVEVCDMYKDRENPLRTMPVIGAIALDEHFWPGGKGRPSYQEQGEIQRPWLKEHNVLYYARPREDFWIREAIDEAFAGNYAAVVVEDLS